MAWLIIGSFLLVLVVAVIVIAFAIAWALADSEVGEDPELRRRPGRFRAFLKRFWSWANAVPPRLFYRRDKKGRFRKVRRG